MGGHRMPSSYLPPAVMLTRWWWGAAAVSWSPELRRLHHPHLLSLQEKPQHLKGCKDSGLNEDSGLLRLPTPCPIPWNPQEKLLAGGACRKRTGVVAALSEQAPALVFAPSGWVEQGCMARKAPT